MLLASLAIFVLAVVIYVYAVRALDQPAGTRWLWLAMVVAGSCALAANGSHLPTGVKVGAFAVAGGLIVLFARARKRAVASADA